MASQYVLGPFADVIDAHTSSVLACASNTLRHLQTRHLQHAATLFYSLERDLDGPVSAVSNQAMAATRLRNAAAMAVCSAWAPHQQRSTRQRNKILKVNESAVFHCSHSGARYPEPQKVQPPAASACVAAGFICEGQNTKNTSG